MDDQLTFGSLFSGIGGIDLGFERAGMRCAWQCEFDPYCRRVLSKHWPDVECYPDVRALAYPPAVDVLVGGFPCQPFSLAGKRKAQDDPRHLWPEFARLVGELRPRYVVGENVRGLTSKGLDLVLADLAGLGYDAEWQVVSASAVGAPHLRERVFIVAYPNADGEGRTDSEGRPGPAWPDRRTVFGPDAYQAGAYVWEPEPSVDRVAHGVPARMDRLRALGNAVVPQVAEFVGSLIVEHAAR